MLSAEVQEFIKNHESDDLSALLLHRKKYSALPLNDIVDQIKARKKAKKKLPTWYKSSGILFPKPLSIEQSSSEKTASWKAQYIGTGKSGVDLTGGFGVDSFAFAEAFDDWLHIEANKKLSEIARHNARQMGKENIRFENLSAEQYLDGLEKPIDLIYIDPDRRPGKNRVIGFEESTPDVSVVLPKILTRSNRILIKASPMIDITAGLRQLSSVTEVIVLGVDNEVKEVLFYIEPMENKLQVRCVNIKSSGQETFIYKPNDISQEDLKIGKTSAYLYEPNATILKAGGQDTLAVEYQLVKLHRNTNLYTSADLKENFPGRVFKVNAVESYNRKTISAHLPEGKANLSTRNFVDNSEQMKKKLGLKDGGDCYLFGYRDVENKNKVAVCKKAV